MALYVGCMSGTSLDGVDAVLAEFPVGEAPRVWAHAWEPYCQPLRDELLALNADGPRELHRASLAANAVARAYADVVQRLLDHSGRVPLPVAIGAHGQTVRHRPQAFDGTGYTVQLLNGALLAELTGLDVVCDFRSADVAAGGQGAPLVPAFHHASFADPRIPTAVLNIGGIANVTLLPGEAGPVLGYDCGPGNLLMDLWAERHLGTRYDADGEWARSGRLLPGLLAVMQSHPFFALLPPKSTGRDDFHLDWLEGALARSGSASRAPFRAQDVQATLAELTAWATAQSLRRDAPGTTRLLVCGGGARNGHLMTRLRAALPAIRVEPTDTLGVPADQVEALAFAWLAQACIERRPGNLPAVTAATGPRILGARYTGPGRAD
ncbi:MAG: anhydro-N-acetylmuramic acid kinase [Pseudomonadota bacterium]|jgi:anhydro-N-acetylmuramic acid kinase